MLICPHATECDGSDEYELFCVHSIPHKKEAKCLTMTDDHSCPNCIKWKEFITQKEMEV